MDGFIGLRAGELSLAVAPEWGGSLASFCLGDVPLMARAWRPAGGPPLCSFPLVPFSNRIAHGRFRFDGAAVTLPMDDAYGHPLHGFGWRLPWQVVAAAPARCLIRHDYQPGPWPWAYQAEQDISLDPAGLRLAMTLTNKSSRPMPAGLGFHPYFPRTGAQMHAPHGGKWQTAPDCLPVEEISLNRQPDWFSGDLIDHAFTRRQDDPRLTWPDRMIRIQSSPELAITTIYIPPGEDYFCVEPVSHMTDAVNRPEPPARTGLRVLQPGASLTVWTRFAVSRR